MHLIKEWRGNEVPTTYFNGKKIFYRVNFFTCGPDVLWGDTLGRLFYSKERKLLVVWLFNAAPQIAQMASLIGPTNLAIFLKIAHA